MRPPPRTGTRGTTRPNPLARAITRLICGLVMASVSALATGFDLQGHRGARGLAPENTIAGFKRALAIGVTTLELDTGITADGVVVISHDPRLDPAITRYPDGRWLEGTGPPISSLTYRQLQSFDVGRIRSGSEYSKRFPRQRGADHVRIPRLADLLALLQRAGADAVRLNIETKIFPEEPHLTAAPRPFARALIAELRAAGAERRATIQSFDWRTLAIVQAEAPEIPTVYLTAEQPWMDNIARKSQDAPIWTADVRFAEHGSVPRMVKAAGGAAWSPYYGDLTRALVDEAHALGLRVVPWTVNAREDMDRLIDWGVDGIISDYPDLLREAVAARGGMLPAPIRVR